MNLASQAEIFQAWAPEGARWSAWVKPVVFAFVGMPRPASAAAEALSAPPTDATAVPVADGQSAVVVDLAGERSVAMGLALARQGYRPIPLFNAAPGTRRTLPAPNAAVDMVPILAALEAGAAELAGLGLALGAPPAFLLDSRRRRSLQKGERWGIFDNRSVSLPTDFPSAELLLSHGICRAFVALAEGQPEPQPDLAHALRRWQEAGIALLRLPATGQQAVAVPMVVSKPAYFRWAWQGWIARLGLVRSPFGGFGGFLPSGGMG